MSAPGRHNASVATASANLPAGVLPADLIVIEGAPCTGKTTLAAFLGQVLGLPTLLEPAGRRVLPAPASVRLHPTRRELFMAVLQWRWLRRAARRLDRPIIADFSPLKAAVRLWAGGHRRLFSVLRALAYDVLGPSAVVVVLTAPAEVLLQRWAQRGEDPPGPHAAQRLSRLAQAYREVFSRPQSKLQAQALIETSARTVEAVAREVLKVLSASQQQADSSA